MLFYRILLDVDTPLYATTCRWTAFARTRALPPTYTAPGLPATTLRHLTLDWTLVNGCDLHILPCYLGTGFSHADMNRFG